MGLKVYYGNIDDDVDDDNGSHIPFAALEAGHHHHIFSFIPVDHSIFQHHCKRIISTNVNMTTFNTSESTPSYDHPHHQLQKQNDHRLWVVSRLPANHSPSAVPNLSARLTSYLSHPSLGHSFSFYRNRVWSLSLTNCAWGWWKSYLISSWHCFLMLMKALTIV